LIPIFTFALLPYSGGFVARFPGFVYTIRQGGSRRNDLLIIQRVRAKLGKASLEAVDRIN
jgi:hypothetical protein